MLTKRHRLIAPLALGLFLGLASKSHATRNSNNQELSTFRAERNVFGYHPNALSRFFVEGADDAVMQHIAHRFDIEYRQGQEFSVLVAPWRTEELLTLVPDAELADEEISQTLLSSDYAGPAGYRDYDQVRESFETWSKSYPDIVTLVDQPDMVSGNGKPFIVAKITKDAKKEHPDRPNIVITGATHGDEHLTTESILLNVEKLIKGYASSPRFKAMIDGANIYIVPVVSPDSFLRSRRVHGVDPNRVYDYPGDSSPGTKLKSANAMMEFYKAIEPAGVLDFHGAPPRGMIMYPWGYAKRKGIENDKDRALHEKVVSAMGKATPGYDAGPIWSTIYVAPGTSTDYNYFAHKMLAVVIEIGGGDKSPPISEIPSKAKEIEEATWLFIEALIPESKDDEDNDESNDADGEDESNDDGKGESNDEETPSPEPSEQEPDETSEEKPEEESKEASNDDGTPDASPKDTPEPSEQEPQASASTDGDASSDASVNQKDAPGGCEMNPSTNWGWLLLPFGLLAWRRHT